MPYLRQCIAKTSRWTGTTPTLLLTAYGGFQVSAYTPYYDAVMGKLWLERGGAFVLANIRGGGEFGPAWHDAGLKDAPSSAFMTTFMQWPKTWSHGSSHRRRGSGLKSLDRTAGC